MYSVSTLDATGLSGDVSIMVLKSETNEMSQNRASESSVVRFNLGDCVQEIESCIGVM